MKKPTIIQWSFIAFFICAIAMIFLLDRTHQSLPEMIGRDIRSLHEEFKKGYYSDTLKKDSLKK